MKYFAAGNDGGGLPRDIVCFSHLRWGFVYQRPQHLLSRFRRNHRVIFIEEPVHASSTPRFETHVCPESGVLIVVPHFSSGLGNSSEETILKLLLNDLFTEQQISDYLAW